MRIRSGVGLAGVAIGVSLSATSAQASNIFDAIGQALFGARPAQPEMVQEPVGGLDLTVRPRSRALARPARTHEPRRIENTAIDPVKNPTWYLQDPTMRKGDVVVLNGEVLVFNGGRPPHTRADFSALYQSRLVSRPLRDRIRAMAGLPPEQIPAVAPAVKRADVSVRRDAAQE